ncbi:hypothetical protein ACP0F6_24520 [Escherichia coli]|uniref:hypothetical protein n=1 Tax=Escherichia coli TaxID=562 RepID=UPI003CF724CE
MARSAKPRKRKPAPQRSKLPRYVVKLHPDDFFDEEDAEVLRFDNFDDAVECCADLGISRLKPSPKCWPAAHGYWV